MTTEFPPAASNGNQPLARQQVLLSPEYLTPERKQGNLLADASFENGDSSVWRLEGWHSDERAGSFPTGTAHAGRRAALLWADGGNDVRLVQSVGVKPQTNYLFSGWVKTDDVVVTQPGGGIGANLCLMHRPEHSRPRIVGTVDWTYLAFLFNSATQTEVRVGVRLGHFGSLTRGSAWFDDLCLIAIADSHALAGSR